MRRSRVISLLLACGVALGGCSGRVVIDTDKIPGNEPVPCGDIFCEAGDICFEGTCLSGDDPCAGVTEGPCLPCDLRNPGGSCPEGLFCIVGNCRREGTGPAACGPGQPGWCQEGYICDVDLGECRLVDPENVCSPDNPAGECAADQVCVDGICYDDLNIYCTPTNLIGLCEDRSESCLEGECIEEPTSCSPAVPGGSCPSWQACVEGLCLGPVPPDRCTDDEPNGRCPAGEVCVAGTCAPIADYNECSAARPAGLCSAGFACVLGACAEVLPGEECSEALPAGLCEGGAVCEEGVCVWSPCDEGGLACEASAVCDGAGLCVALPCDPPHPEGYCENSTHVCVGGLCMEPTCSVDYPDGTCPVGESCDNGTCRTPLCSVDYLEPDGWCPDPTDLCANGVCVNGPCAGDNLDGTCDSIYQSCQPGVGCGVADGVFTSDVCCDDTLATATGCSRGTCTEPPCSLDEPLGFCEDPLHNYCDNGTCVVAPCDDHFFEGYCPDSKQSCFVGNCRIVGCIYEEFPDIYCGPTMDCLLTDDYAFGICVLSPCSSQYTGGICETPGEVCCKDEWTGPYSCTEGDCFAAPCSMDFPGGNCPTGEVCSGGACVVPPCTPNFPTGNCGANFVCNDGVCELAPCGPAAPLGFCDADADGTPRRCISEVCQRYECSSAFPSGPCPIGFICESQSCVEPVCSDVYPGGVCPVGQICLDDGSGFACEDGPCSSAYPSGRCGEGFTCNNGLCEPAPCSLASIHGPCLGADIGKVCLNGTCVDYLCGSDFPSGPCLAPGEVCIGQTCVVPNCDTDYPGGYCAPPAVCVAPGVCQTPGCSPSVLGGLCPTNYTCCNTSLETTRGCSLGTCILAACGDTGTSDVGYCPPGEVCDDIVCDLYLCSSEYPEAPCLTPGEVCLASVCAAPPCSDTYPAGYCTDPDVCVGGDCQTPACSLTVTDGACPSEQVCCDAGLAGTRGCTEGTCVIDNCPDADGGYCPIAGDVCADDNVCYPYACGSVFPDGPCSTPGEICISETCQPPPCSTAYIGGVCTVAGEVCVNGVCTELACSPTVTDGVCTTGKVCCNPALETTRGCVLGTCVLADCSPTNDEGWCPVGQVCCGGVHVPGFCDVGEVGDCLPTTCSSSFPSGACPVAGEVCVNGSCQVPCDDANRTAWCPSGFACVEGACSPTCTDDDDCDGISNAHENLTAPLATALDTDGDGSPDGIDRDADDDLLPDAVEAGDYNLGTPPANSDGIGDGDWRVLDADSDHISDTFEAGPAPGAPRDTDGDGLEDFRDSDSDADGVPDACEVADIGGPCNTAGIVADATVADTNGDGLHDYRDLDSDSDGISDCLESIDDPAVGAALADCVDGIAQGGGEQSGNTDHDGDGTPDYRDYDADGDGVADIDEDSNGDGIVNCQLDGTGAQVSDPRPDPACGSTASPFDASYPYNYNPGCPGDKCLLAESSRIHTDSDGDGTLDGADGVFLVCSTDNLKPINVFYSQPADFALALEQTFDRAVSVSRGGVQAGVTFDDASSSNGSAAVSGFILQRTPSATAIAITNADPARELIEKALGQEAVDRSAMAGATDVNSVTLVINRNFTSFDGYGVVSSRYNVATSSNVSTRLLRDRLAGTLDDTVTGYSDASDGFSATAFTLLTETLYRYDDAGSIGSVIVVGALVRTGSDYDSIQTFNYRTRCSQQSIAACPSRPGCVVNGTQCEESPSYQIPLFFADNVTNGSALTQWGDDLAALCQSLIQENGVLDFLWVVDDSGSMGQEIAQVQTSSNLFFGIMNNTEADYRVAQTTTFEDRSDWEPTSDFSNASGDESNRRNGMLQGGFTGAISGLVGRCTDVVSQVNCDADPVCYWDGAQTPSCRWLDREVTYLCSEGCDNGAGNCCSSCPSGAAINDPACFFASRLPTASGRGSEFGLTIGQWAMHRSGVESLCTSAPDSTVCNATSGCTWSGGLCMPDYCRLPGCSAVDQATCEEEAGCDWRSGACYLGIEATGSQFSRQDECNGHDPAGTSQVPYGHDYGEDELEPANCEWNPVVGACWPTFGYQCSLNTSEGNCDNQGPRCRWDTSTGTGYCVPDPTFNQVLCNQTTSAACEAQGGGWCEWDASGFCRPPLVYRFRPGASKVALMFSDEEDCYVKDNDWNGSCDFGEGEYLGFTHPVRLLRERSYLDFYESRGFMVFGILGDKADRSLAPSSANGGCATAQAGEAYISVAESTGGGWGSICAANLFPSTEAIILGSLGRASPYKLEGFIAGNAVQPISSTIKVAVEVCDLPSEYPLCASGTHVEVVPRSRDAGFDYDTINNTLILYGGARPVLEGDIVVSYRYWIDLPQDPWGDPDCPCPETDGPGCNCGMGQACGYDGTLAGGITDSCGGAGSEAACEGLPGCAWNTANSGGCFPTGLCEPDPNCGGYCPPGTICDPLLGLCVCDPTCADACDVGTTCDNNVNFNGCQGLIQASCTGASDCSWDVPIGACYSDTCGECLCDTSCGGGCPVGQSCDNTIGSPTCGQCACDITCGGGCAAGTTCNDGSACAGVLQTPCTADPGCAWSTSLGECYSPSCGFCQPPQCGNCPAGFVCDYDTGLCICDPTCGGSCPDGRDCQDNTGLDFCGQCLCELDCGQAGCAVHGSESACEGGGCSWDGSSCSACIAGSTACDNDPGSSTCGLCVSALDCSGGCNEPCAYGSEGTCNADTDCRWAPWLGAAGACHPVVCQNCAPPPIEQCLADATCCGACGEDNGGNPADTCNINTGSCECDTNCGGGCPNGRNCDEDPAHVETCGQCLCDTSCGGPCGPGTECDVNLVSPTCGLCIVDPTCGGPCNPACTFGTQATCDADSECRWAPWMGAAGACYPIACEDCDPLVGLCVVDSTCCGACGPNETCNAITGACECNTDCGGTCPGGTVCDDDTDSTTCGQCVCDDTCGGVGACPAGTLCDEDLDSASCGLCLADPTCGQPGGDCNPSCSAETDSGDCDARAECRWASWMNAGAGGCYPLTCQLCNPSVGFCQPDPECCGACGPTETCNALTGECECDTACGFACGPGLECDGNTANITCGQCLCDTTCGGDCPQGQVCDDNSECGGLDASTCAVASSCEWAEELQECRSVFCGLCIIDLTCGGCPPGWVCNPTTGICEPECPDCPAGEICDPLTGTCICDQSCGVALGLPDCPIGSQCDGELASFTCGQCVCEATCGQTVCAPLGGQTACLDAGCFWDVAGGTCEACGPGTLCDDGTACTGLDTSAGGTCEEEPDCMVDTLADECVSPTCGWCVIDPLCGEPCPPGWVCDGVTGLCVPDADCNCDPGLTCDPVTLICRPCGEEC